MADLGAVGMGAGTTCAADQMIAQKYPTIMPNLYAERLKLREILDERNPGRHRIRDRRPAGIGAGIIDQKDRQAIRDEVLAQASCVTNALSTKELQNEGARLAYSCDAMATVRQLINWRATQRT